MFTRLDFECQGHQSHQVVFLDFFLPKRATQLSQGLLDVLDAEFVGNFQPSSLTQHVFSDVNVA